MAFSSLGIIHVNIPNIITISRIVISVIFTAVCSLWWNSFWGRITAIILALFAEATDVADGYIARKHNQVSNMGKLLDPYADKIWRFSAFLCIGMRGYAELWMIAVIFWRMLTVSHLRTMAVMKGTVIAARVSGKVKAIIQGIGIIAVLACAAAQKYVHLRSIDLPFVFTAIAWWIMCFVTAVTFFSALDYVHAHRDVVDR